ncbi:Beta-lactamase superfamily domain-containing protein [Nocardioides exalbidus]|uniref:Beta-lactamase superfamily domain-containing protein n=1 Tax=Nocardioides exalbidus TaxID=402596 RepID=A0A1H4YAQ7_9ACTN|nr:MBL fold metallo-hydrolase [Nocardioides exalbidus]SED14094.1 Beta-lactamase superfamily domain-containing protein [Nocardioides exalbidus]
MDTLTFIGTATTIIKLGSFTLLTDPNFLHRGQRAYLGKGLWSRRLTEPSMQPADLPLLDAIVLVHLHGDHFDRVARAGLGRDQPVFTTPNAARRLRTWNFAAHGLQTMQQETLTRGDETLTIEALPGLHARGVMGALLPPVMGSLLTRRRDGVQRTVYLSGDTLTGSHISDIHARHREIDVTVMHLGGTRVLSTP